MPITTSTMIAVMNEFFDDVGFEKDGRDFLLPVSETLCQNSDFVLAKSLYENGKMTKDLLMQKIEKISQSSNLHNYTVALVLLISFTAHLKKLYLQKGYDIDMYKNTVADLRYKALECYEVKGMWGTFVADWQYKFFELGRFAFGRLQGELLDLPPEAKSVTDSATAIKIHIPRNGSPLTPESIDLALSQIRNFFADEIDTPMPVFCSSYLLYPEFSKLYSEQSNLAKFTSRFTIINSKTDPEGQYPNMWRLFDMDYTGNIDDFPERTSLHKRVKQYLKDGNRTGIGDGLFLF